MANIPSITGMSPATFDDGRSVTLTGSGLAGASVSIGGVAQTVTASSDSSLTFTAVRGSQSVGACRVDVVGVDGGYSWVFEGLSTGIDAALTKDESHGTVAWNAGGFVRVTWTSAGVVNPEYRVDLHDGDQDQICVQYDVRRNSTNRSKQLKITSINTGGVTGSNVTFGPTVGGYSGANAGYMGISYDDHITGGDNYTSINLLGNLAGGGQRTRAAPTVVYAAPANVYQDVSGDVWETWKWWVKFNDVGQQNGEFAVWRNDVLQLHLTSVYNCGEPEDGYRYRKYLWLASTMQDGPFPQYEDYRNLKIGYTRPAISPAAWQIPTAGVVPAKMPMRLIHPAVSTTSTYIYENWYTGMPLDLPVCVQGGAWPFHYELTAAPSGMSVGANYGDANYGRIVWTSPTAGAHPVTVQVTDQHGNQVTRSWTLTVGTSKHVFFDATSGNNSTGDGTIGNPYQNFSKFASTVSATNALNGKIAVYRAGTYATSASDALTVGTPAYYYQMRNTKPLVHMAYPGESVTFDWAACTWQWEDYSGTEAAIIGVTMSGINNALTGTQAYYFRLANSDRTLFDRVTFGQQSALANTPVNPACVGFRDAGASVDCAITGCTFDGLNNVFAVELYDLQYVLIEGCTQKNLVALGSYYAKLGTVSDVTIRANTGTLNNATVLARMDNYSAVDRVEVCWNNFKTSAACAVEYGDNGPVAGADGWLYRNTIQAAAGQAAVFTHTNSITLGFDNNVFVHDGAYTGGVRQSSYTGSLAQTNQLAMASTAYTDASGALTGSYRTSYLGTHGYEVA